MECGKGCVVILRGILRTRNVYKFNDMSWTFSADSVLTALFCVRGSRRKGSLSAYPPHDEYSSPEDSRHHRRRHRRSDPRSPPPYTPRSPHPLPSDPLRPISTPSSDPDRILQVQRHGNGTGIGILPLDYIPSPTCRRLRRPLP